MMKQITANNDGAAGSESANNTSMVSSFAATVVSATQRSEVDFLSKYWRVSALLPSCSRGTDNYPESENQNHFFAEVLINDNFCFNDFAYEGICKKPNLLHCLYNTYNRIQNL